MSHYGDITLGDTIHVKFSTVATTGAPTTLAGTPEVSAYVGGSLTQITAGITLTVDYDSVTGLHDVTVVASSGNGFTTATNVSLVITTGTVGGTSVVGYVVGSFSIGNRSAFARLGAPAGASVSADVAAVKAETASILTDTAEIGAAGAGLTALATAADLATVAGYLDTEIAAILADTNELQTDWANGGRLDLILDARASQASVDTVDGIVDAILLDTAEIGAAGAGLTALATQASVNTIDDFLDTEVAAIKTKTDYLPSATAGAAGGLFIAGSNAATTAATLTVTGAFSINGTGTVAQTGDSYPFGSRTVCRGTVSATSPSTTGFTASAMSPSGAVADQFKGRILIFDLATTTAALRGQATDVTANTNAALPVFTFTALTTAPVSGDTFSIV